MKKSNTHVRFSVSVPEDLLRFLDETLIARGYASRSEFVRDLIRKEMIEEKWEKGEEVIGVLIIIYDHHKRGLSDKLIEIQHNGLYNIISSLHIHLSHDDCLEVIVIRGKGEEVNKLYREMEGLDGVKFAKMVKVAHLEV